MDKAFEIPLGALAEVPLKLIDPDPEQPRKDFDEHYIENELAPSIKRDGVIQPIVVRNNPEQPGRFLIVAGENRWRASQYAKTKTIPAIRREVDGIGKLLIQLKENHQRKDLNAMEWALAFQAMHKTHGLKQTEIEKTLKDAGVGHFGRAYISNHIRLLELPEWAQRLIRFNAITASHGKHLLPAMASKKVIEIMAERMDGEECWRPSIVDLQNAIYWNFARNHKNLTGYETDFDYQAVCVKTGCQKKRKVTGDTEHMAGTFCLDRECWEVQQAEALRQVHDKPQGESHGGDAPEGSQPRELELDDQGRVDVEAQQIDAFRELRYLTTGPKFWHAKFDVNGCDGCAHRHPALIGSDTESQEEHDACFLVSCYLEKEKAANRALDLARRFIGETIASRFEESPDQAFRFLAWTAVECPSLEIDDEGERLLFGAELDFGGWDNNSALTELLFSRGMTGLSEFMRVGVYDLGAVAATGIRRMAEFGNGLYDEVIAELAQWFQIRPDDYHIDEHFLAEHTEAEILALFSEERVGLIVNTEIENAAKDGKLDSAALRHRDRIEVPAEIRFAFEQLMQTDDE